MSLNAESARKSGVVDFQNEDDGYDSWGGDVEPKSNMAGKESKSAERKSIENKTSEHRSVDHKSVDHRGADHRGGDHRTVLKDERHAKDHQKSSLAQIRINKHKQRMEQILAPKEPEKRKKVDLNDDFMSFDDVNETDYMPKNKEKGPQNDSESDLETKIGKRFDKARYPWLSKRTLKIKDIFLFLHSEILDFVEFVSQTKEDKRLREEVVNRIKNVVHKAYPEAQVLVFGSCATGLNLPQSDIDLLVYYPAVREHTMINRLTHELVKTGNCASIEPIKNAKVPIIKLQDKATAINVDISFNRENGIYCVKLVRQLMQRYPEMRPLLLVIKSFLKSRQLNETYHGGVSSFLLTMLITSYLQRQYKKGSTGEMDLGKHLIDFFELYGTQFNYEDLGISIRKGGKLFRKS